MVTPSAMPRGMIVTLCSGSAPGVIAATSACPASWYAVFFFSSSERIIDFRSAPIRTLSLDISKSAMMTNLRFCRAAHRARFVHQVGEIRAGKARSAAREDREIHIFGDGNLARVHAENFFAALDVGPGNDHAAVKTAGPQQCGIENVGAVRGGDQDDAFVGFEAVHFDEQRVQRLFAFVVAAAEARAAMASDGVNFVDENDAGSVFLALLEQIAHAAGADADEHFDEVRTGDRKERNVRFARNGACQQSFSGSRRADEQHALGNASAELLEFLRVFQEVDDFLQALPWLLRYRLHP